MFSRLIHRRFLAQVALTPGKPAIRERDRETSFEDLARAARRVAGALQLRALRAGSRVAIATSGHRELLSGILGVVGSGHIYVALDLAQSDVRLLAQLGASRPVVAIVDDEGRRRLQEITPGISVLALGDEEGALDAADPDAPCSIYFTSGSTGAPRAILGRLSGIDHHVAWEIEALSIDRAVRGAIVHAPSYDAYLPDVLVPLCAGGIAIAPPDRGVLADAHRFATWLLAAEITLLHCTPSYFRVLLEANAARDLRALVHVVLAGEVVRPIDIERARDVLGDKVALWNLYGPSEATLVKLHHRITEDDARAERVPIGRPMPGVTVHVLDAADTPGRDDEVGQIAIQSAFASHGYLDEPDVTAARFRPVGGETMYLTGDYGRRRPDGAFEFHGRRDRQLKLLGARIDLDEIEAIVLACEGVTEAAAITDRGATAVFVFVTTNGVSIGEIRARAMARLSPAMRVAKISASSELPRTASGKIDRVELVRRVEAVA